MNRKNLTAAVLAGLAGVAGLAGTAQAVNLNPDGLGQVLIYPFYTSNNGSQTILSVVNTTDHAKAVKVRFLEGYNSREVLDFNLYLSHHDVWVAAIYQPQVSTGGEGVATLIVPDSSCTVPYLYGNGIADGLDYGVQEFLPYAYTGDYEDGGPTDIQRAAVGHFEMIEMGRLTNDSARAATELLPKRVGSATAATHVLGEDGSELPYDCEQLVRNWTLYGATPPDPLDGMWAREAAASADDQAWTDTRRNTGGLFGGAAVVNVANGTMFSYDAKAVQGFDKTYTGLHAYPGTIYPSLDSGNQTTATVFFGTPQNEAIDLFYPRGVEAVSAVFMHNHVMNTFNTEEILASQTDWVLTFPTKSFYVDSDIVGTTSVYIPDVNDPLGCNGWEPGDWFPPGDKDGVIDPEDNPDWSTCDYVKVTFGNVIPPFTEAFNGDACETVFYSDWNREESPRITPGVPNIPPIVSPPPPGPPRPEGPPAFQLCYETNILQFVGENTEPVFPATDLVATVVGAPASGWASIDMSLIADKDHDFPFIELHQDSQGLVGLPVTGFAAEEYVNNFLTGGVIAHYGGLFQHKSSVKRISPECEYHMEGYCEL